MVDGVDPSREEAWVLHAAVLDHIERAVDADRGVAVLERVEGCGSLDADDCSLVRDAVTAYLDGDAPERDRARVGRSSPTSRRVSPRRASSRRRRARPSTDRGRLR